VDKKGLAIALIFLIAIALWAGWRRDQTDQVITWREQPDVSAEITIRPAGKNVLEEETAQRVQSLAGLTGALHDPRQGRWLTKLHTTTSGGLMSSSMVTIEVPRAENETVFLLHVVQAALKAYRNTQNASGQMIGAPGLFSNALRDIEHEEAVLSPASA
jgi:hypothetical protein